MYTWQYKTTLHLFVEDRYNRDDVSELIGMFVRKWVICHHFVSLGTLGKVEVISYLNTHSSDCYKRLMFLTV